MDIKVLPHLAYVATLPCETLLPAKHALNDTLQGSVATYLRYGEVLNSQIKKGSLLSLQVKKKFKSANIWQSYKQNRDYLAQFSSVLARRIQCMRQPRSRL